MRASAIASGVSLSNDDDTDSVSSSVSSFADSASSRRKKGVSPLHRRRSLRLAIKNGAVDASDIWDLQTALIKQPTFAGSGLFRGLIGQNTVEMVSPPPPLERMETSTRWKSYRNKKPMLSAQDTIGGKKRIVQRMDTSPDLAPPIKKTATVRWSDGATADGGQESWCPIRKDPTF